MENQIKLQLSKFGIKYIFIPINPSKVVEQCFDRWHNHEYLIIVLDDDDLSKLLIYADNQQHDEIVSYMNKKIEDVRDRKN